MLGACMQALHGTCFSLQPFQLILRLCSSHCRHPTPPLFAMPAHMHHPPPNATQHPPTHPPAMRSWQASSSRAHSCSRASNSGESVPWALQQGRAGAGRVGGGQAGAGRGGQGRQGQGHGASHSRRIFPAEQFPDMSAPTRAIPWYCLLSRCTRIQLLCMLHLLCLHPPTQSPTRGKRSRRLRF